MLARLQRGLLACGLLCALFWAWACWRAGLPMWGMVGVLVLVGGHSLVLAAEFIALLAVRRGDPAPRASAAELTRAWLGECVVSWRVFCWQQPFRARRWADLPGLRGERGLIFVHGFLCNRGFWNPWLERCHAERRAFAALSLEPVFTRPDAYVSQIDAAVVQMTQETGLTPVIVAHSMGGVAVRAWLASMHAATRVHRVITIATPHRGTWMARWSPTEHARAMRLQSAWLQTLEAQEANEPHAASANGPGPASALCTCFWGHADNIVMPPSAALWPGAAATHLRATAHVAMAFRPEVWAELLCWLGPGKAAASGTQGVSAGAGPGSACSTR